jgi:hypothetical protein
MAAKKKAIDWANTPEEVRHRRHVHWTLPADLIESLTERARKEGRPVSQLVEELLRRGL